MSLLQFVQKTILLVGDVRLRIYTQICEQIGESQISTSSSDKIGANVSSIGESQILTSSSDKIGANNSSIGESQILTLSSDKIGATCTLLFYRNLRYLLAAGRQIINSLNLNS